MMDQSPNDEMTLYKENPFHPLTDEGLREGQGGGGWYQCRKLDWRGLNPYGHNIHGFMSVSILAWLPLQGMDVDRS